MKLSIVTVTFQAASTLPMTASSVAAARSQLAQGESEYIVVDGGSTDGTLDLVHSLVDKGQVDRWSSGPDKGIYDAMNKAVAMASGDYLLFMNAGDCFADPLVLSRVLPQLGSHDLVYGDCVMIMMDGAERADPALPPDQIRKRMVCSHQSLFARRAVLERFPFDLSFPVAADHHFMLRAIENGSTTLMLGFPVARVQLEPYSLSQILKGNAEKHRAVASMVKGPGIHAHFWLRGLRLLMAAFIKLFWRPRENARFLFRLDDACPWYDRDSWDRLEAIFDQYGVKPLVAVIPDCQDPDLKHWPMDPQFRSRALSWQRKGWAIALHGYQHRFVSSLGGLVPLNHYSEFAGLDLEHQKSAIRAGWKLLCAMGLAPAWWVAPAHSFDRNTLLALASETTIRHISDGLSDSPWRQAGFAWVPQQLWRPRSLKKGIWTICLHPNEMTDKDFVVIESFLASHQHQLGSWAALQARSVGHFRPRGAFDRLFAMAFLALRRLKAIIRRKAAAA